MIFARVTAAGAIAASRTIASVDHTADSGGYTLHVTGAPDLSHCVAMAQAQNAAAIDTAQAMALTNANGTVDVSTVGPNGNGGGTAAVDEPFAVTVSC